MAVKGAGRNCYYKKIDATNNEETYYDINPSGVYGDLFEGQATTAVIKGGAESRYYLSDMVIPDSDSFGEGELVGLKQYYFPTDITLSDDSYTPELKLWKLKQQVGETNEGNITVNNRAVTVITANTSLEVPWIYEPFNQGASKIENINDYQTVSTYGDPYISLETAFIYQNRNLSMVDLGNRYGTNINTGAGNETVIFITKKTFLGNRFVPSGNLWTTWGANAILGVSAAIAGATVVGAGISAFLLGNLTYDQEWAPVDTKFSQIDVHFIGIPNDRLKYTTISERTSILSETLTEKDADMTNTIIQNVYKSGDIKVFDDDNNRLISAKATMSTDEYLTEGQSLKLRTYWHQNVAGGTEGMQKFDDDWGPWDCDNRQEVKVTFEFPYPHSIDTAGDSTLRTGDKPEGQGFTEKDWFTSPSISMDLNIGELSPMFRAYGDSSGQRGSFSSGNNYGSYAGAIRQCAWVRGLAITFSRTNPRSNESFYTFMARTQSETLAEQLADKRDEAISEVSAYGNAAAVLIGKIPVKFASPTITQVDANLNLDGVEKWPNYPIVALPWSSRDYPIVNDPGAGTGADTDHQFNLGNLYETDSGSTGFHEVDGKCIHWYHHGTNTTAEGAVPLGNTGVVLEPKKWLNFKFTLYKGKLHYQIKDSKTGEAISKPLELVGWNGTDVFANSKTCPKYVTVWNYNYHGRGNYPNLQPSDVSMYILGHYDETSGAGDWGTPYMPYSFTTENTLYVDNVMLSGFNHTHSNATVTDNNPFKGKINIPSNSTNIVTSSTSNAGLDATWPSSTYVSLGFDNQEDFDKAASGATHNLWFGGISSSSNLEALHHSASDIAIRAGFTSNAADERIGGQSNQTFFTYATSPSNTGSGTPFANKGINTTGTALRGLDFDGNTQVDNFSRKGGVILDFKSDQVTFGTQTGGPTATPARRENLFTSARILDIAGAEEGLIGVDNVNIFDLPDDTEYVIYKLNQNKMNVGNTFNGEWGVGSSIYKGLVVKLKERPSGDGYIRVNKDCRFSQAGLTSLNWEDFSKEFILEYAEWQSNKLLCHEIWKNTLWISPLKYWLTLEIRNTSSVEGTQGPGRSYSTVCMVNQGSSLPTTSDFGSTFNEYIYTDAGDYLNAWNLIPSIEDCVVETQKDYGYGIMSEELPNAGFITSTNVTADLDTYSKWLVLDATPAIEKDNLEEGEIFSTMLSPANHMNLSSMSIATSESTDKIVNQTYGSANTKRPFALAIYRDEIPVISNFKVTPNETNPYYADFTWNVDADDTWYGFIIIDKDIPSHQYHKSPWHVPMWRPLPSSENNFMNWPPSLDDSEGDIIDYKHNTQYQYGFYRADKDYVIKPDHTRPSASTTKGAHTKGTVADYTTFLDPEGLSGWCHNFSGEDLLWVAAPTEANPQDEAGVLNEEKCSFNVHIRPTEYPTIDAGIAEFGGKGAHYSGASLLLESDGKISAYFGAGWNEDGHAVHLKSHSVAPLDGTPTNIIITFDKTLSHGNCKLFINGKLEDQSGKAVISGNGTTSRWDSSKKLRIDGKTMYATWYLGGGPGTVIGSENFKGRMEEVIYYPYVIYPVNPSEGKFTWTAPVSDMDTSESNNNGSPISYFARLFVKDFHNIRGTSHKEVSTSAPITIHRAGVKL